MEKIQTVHNKALRCALHKDDRLETKEQHSLATLQKHTGESNTLYSLILHMYRMSQLQGFKGWKLRPGRRYRPAVAVKMLMVTKKTNTTNFTNSITYLGPKTWISLPESLQKAPSYKAFKINLEKLTRLTITNNVVHPLINNSPNNTHTHTQTVKTSKKIK